MNTVCSFILANRLVVELKTLVIDCDMLYNVNVEIRFVMLP